MIWGDEGEVGLDISRPRLLEARGGGGLSRRAKRRTTLRPDLTIHHPMSPCVPPSPNKSPRRGYNERGTIPRAEKYSAGTVNATPRKRPNMRWPYSQK